MEILAVFAVFVVFPPGAAIVGLLFFCGFIRQRRYSALAAALLWWTYAVYESLMYLRILCTGECNIRVDLLLIYPLLLLASLVSVILMILQRRTHRPS